MRIILVQPDIIDVSKRFHVSTLGRYPSRMPLGILYLAAILRDKGHTVKVYDNALTENSNDHLSELILSNDPNLVGFSVTFKTIGNAREVAKRLKRKRHDLKIVFGGPQASCLPVETLNNPCVDFVLVGEAEETFPLILEKNFADLDGIPNLYFKDASGKACSPKKLATTHDLDSLPYPARDLLDIDEYKTKWPQVNPLSIIASRGCPYRCTFCGLPKSEKIYRLRKPESVVAEIEQLILVYRDQRIDFVDENFALNHDHVRRICLLLKEKGIEVSWTCNTRVDNVTPEILKVMKDAGLRSIFFGVESASQRTLDFLKKGISIKQINDAFDWCKELAIETFASFMLGIPGESREDVFRSFEFMQMLDPSQFSFQTFVCTPGNELYEFVQNKRLYSAIWENALIISTNQLPKKVAEKMEDEISFRSKLFALFRPFKLLLPASDHNYYYNDPRLKQLVPVVRQTLSDLKNDPVGAIKTFEKLASRLKKESEHKPLIKKIRIYLNLLIGLTYSTVGEKEKAATYAQAIAEMDREVFVPF